MDWNGWLSRQSPRDITLLATAVLIVIAIADYLSGSEISFSSIYVIPVGIAAWGLGRRAAYLLSIGSVVLWLAGDFAAGWTFASWLVPVWNAAIRLVFYVVLVEMLCHIRALNADLESRVMHRTSDLRREIAERERLERELLEVGERERRRLGYDLHDGLCQHLTGTAMAVHVLKEKLARKRLPEADEAEKAVTLIEEGIQLSHSLAKGLQPVDKQSSGLMQALQDFARSTTELFKVSCRFECDLPVPFTDLGAANQLYRIVQEATSNAIKHGRASRIVISLEVDEDGTTLRISDNGTGIRSVAQRAGGMGLKIMAQRAQLIGGRFWVSSNPQGGTVISCTLPQTASTEELVRG